MDSSTNAAQAQLASSKRRSDQHVNENLAFSATENHLIIFLKRNYTLAQRSRFINNPHSKALKTHTSETKKSINNNNMKKFNLSTIRKQCNAIKHVQRCIITSESPL